MNNQLNVNIHNRFDVEVRNIKTGKVTQRAVAYNTILDYMWYRLANGNAYASYIHFGTGTGEEIAKDEYELFEHLGYKQAALDFKELAYPKSTWRQKIILEPGEYIGELLTEVGLSGSTSKTNMTTHALLKDSEGDTISVLKTGEDLITIFATVFITVRIDTDYQALYNPEDNDLLKYLTGGSLPAKIICKLGKIPRDSGETVVDYDILSYDVLGSVEISRTADVEDKKIILPTTRFGTTEGNGQIREISMGKIFNFTLPNETYLGTQYDNVSLGGYTGDNDIMLPSTSIDTSSIVSSLSYDILEYPTLIRLAIPNIVPFDGSARVMDISDDGKYAAILVASTSSSAYNYFPVVFKMDNNRLHRIEVDNSEPIAPSGYYLTFSPDSKYLAWVSNRASALSGYNRLAIFKTGDDIFAAEPISGLIDAPYKDICFGKNSNVLFAPVVNSTAIHIYTLSSGQWSLADTINTDSGTNVGGAYISPDGNTLAVLNSAKLYLYAISGSTLTPITSYTPSLSNPTAAAFNPAGTILVVGSDSSPYITAFDLALSTTIPLDTSTAYKVSSVLFSPNGQYMGVGSDKSSGKESVLLYSVSGTTFTKITIPEDLTEIAYKPAFDPASSVFVFSQLKGGENVFAYALNGAAISKLSVDYGAYSTSFPTVQGPIRAYFHTTKPYVFILDSTSSSGCTFYNTSLNETMLKLKAPFPSMSEEMKVSYYVDGIHKTTQHVLDISGYIKFGES